MITTTYTIPNISCGHCVHAITSELIELNGVSKVDGNIETKQVTVQFDAPATAELIENLLAEMNYPVVK